jgi:parvulin-like peptidyl-prolyl isomerase
MLERMLLSDRYVTETIEAFGWTVEQFEEHYAANREDYDFVDYRAFTISGLPADADDWDAEYTEEELDEYRGEQRKLAEEMLSRVTTSDAFWELSKEYIELNIYDGHVHTEECNHGPAEDNTLFEKRPAGSLDDSVSAFLLDTSRRAGDKIMVEDEDDFTVLLFINRYRDESVSVESIDVRHILISVENGEFADDPEGALSRAEEILQMWRDGDADEDYFARLANEHSSDPGSNQSGGLYNNVAPGEMVPSFNDWCFNASRRPGDTGIVETSFGYHIMYFVNQEGDPVPAWQRDVKRDMDNEAYIGHRDGLLDAMDEHTRHWFGMLFTKNRSS